jgi:hypothetical protein
VPAKKKQNFLPVTIFGLKFFDSGVLQGKDFIVSDANLGWTSVKEGMQSDVQQAKLIDVPFPMDAILVESQYQLLPLKQSILTYDLLSSVDSTALFYQQQMERLGWGVVSEICGKKALLIYTKPDKVCSIFVQPHILLIFLQKK